MLSEWTLSKLEPLRDYDCVLVRDPLDLLRRGQTEIHAFATDHEFTVVFAATNLAFRALYDEVAAAPETRKIMVIDHASLRRRQSASLAKAPPPFYPDFLARVPPEARVDLNLRQFLREKTNDPDWPAEADDPRYARLIVDNLAGVLRAHENLRAADAKRFTDHDFKQIVACAALGVPESAFKKLEAQDYWQIGLLSHQALRDLESLAPEVTAPIREQLHGAPAPFCWFVEQDVELVTQAFYLSLILSQHCDHWNLLLANIDPGLANLGGIEPEILRESAPKLIQLDPKQAAADMEAAEALLTKKSLQLVLLDELKLTEPENFTRVLTEEKYSTLLRSLALLIALEDLLASDAVAIRHEVIREALGDEADPEEPAFVETRSSAAWPQLRQAYLLAHRIQSLRAALNSAAKTLKVKKAGQLTDHFFRELWNEQEINRLEYLLSALERHVHSAEFLPRPESELPSAFANARHRVRERLIEIDKEVQSRLRDVNTRFQETVVGQYPSWVQGDGPVVLTSQFLRRCLKPHWDAESERAVLFIFDGMRYDIWEEFLRPSFEERMTVVKEYAGCALLPSETHVSRKAICAGTFPDEFNTRAAEDALLQDALARELGRQEQVEAVAPDTMGTGETVRYRAGNLDVYIFELCDKELHGNKLKTLPDQRRVPARPLAFVYEQTIKNILDTEVMAIVRDLPPGTKVFVTADHGFGPVGDEKIWLNQAWLNENDDCRYRSAWLKESLDALKAPGKVRASCWELPVAALRMPATQDAYNPHTKGTWQKRFSSVLFPKTGYALSRPNSHFSPEAYGHGGISIQELVIPMAVLRVRDQDESLLALDEISGPAEVPEGQEAEFRMQISRPGVTGSPEDEIRVNVEAAYALDPERRALPPQTLFVPRDGAEVAYRFCPDPDDATDDERKQGLMARTLTLTVTRRKGSRTFRKSRTRGFRVNLNSERVVRRVPPQLGNILGLTPKSMR